MQRGGAPPGAPATAHAHAVTRPPTPRARCSTSTRGPACAGAASRLGAGALIRANASVAPREFRSAVCPPDRTTAADDTDTTGPTDAADQTTALPERFVAISLTRRTEPTSAAVIVYRVAFD